MQEHRSQSMLPLAIAVATSIVTLLLLSAAFAFVARNHCLEQSGVFRWETLDCKLSNGPLHFSKLAVSDAGYLLAIAIVLVFGLAAFVFTRRALLRGVKDHAT